MAARQIWIYLTDVDVAWLLALLETREPGLVCSEGRYLRGEARALLEAPEQLERRNPLPGERRIYLFHRKHSADVVAHLQAEGPFAGWKQIDEERSDCLVLRLATTPIPDVLQPARLYAHTSYWRRGEKLRKRPVFALWANQTLRHLIGRLGRTSVRFLRIAPDAQARSSSGGLALSYLYRPIDPRPPEG